MAQSARRNVFDFMAQVNAQTNSVTGVVFATSQNSDGSVQITRNGVILYNKVNWGVGPGQAVSDANVSGDSVLVHNNGCRVPADAQAFIYSLK